MMNKLFLVFLVLLISACSATGPLYTEVESRAAAQEGKIIVYVYRIKQLLGSAASAHIIDNNQDMGVVNVGGYIKYIANSGFHTIHTDTTYFDEPLKLEMKEGEKYFLRVDYEIISSFQSIFKVVNLSKESAQAEIEGTHYQGE